MTASFVLTQTAASAPLAGAWDGVEDGLISSPSRFARFLPTGGSSRPFGIAFGPNSQVQQQWTTSGDAGGHDPAQPDRQRHLLLAGGHLRQDRPHRLGPERHRPRSTSRRERTDLRPARRRRRSREGRHSFTFTVDARTDSPASTILSPQTPISVDEDVRLTTVGEDGYFATLDRSEGQRIVHRHRPHAGQRQRPRTAQPGRAPRDRHDLPGRDQGALPGRSLDGMLGPERARARGQDPRRGGVPGADRPRQPDRRGAPFVDVHVPDRRSRRADCAGISTVECFATFKRGFCQYYAPTMAVILRDLGIPTRIAEGFLPGSRDAERGDRADPRSATPMPGSRSTSRATAGSPFDPTGGNVSQLAPLPSGDPTASRLAAAVLEHGRSPTPPPRSDEDAAASDRRRPARVRWRPGLARSARGRAALLC